MFLVSIKITALLTVVDHFLNDLANQKRTKVAGLRTTCSASSYITMGFVVAQDQWEFEIV